MSINDRNQLSDHDLPGGELPSAVYRSVAVAAVWGLLAAWLAFGRNERTDFDLAIVLVFGIIALSVPRLIRITARHHNAVKSEDLQHFLSSRVETETGQMSGGQAWLEIALIPVSLALAATLLGLVFAFSH